MMGQRLNNIYFLKKKQKKPVINIYSLVHFFLKVNIDLYILIAVESQSKYNFSRNKSPESSDFTAVAGVHFACLHTHLIFTFLYFLPIAGVLFSQSWSSPPLRLCRQAKIANTFLKLLRVFSSNLILAICIWSFIS